MASTCATGPRLQIGIGVALGLPFLDAMTPAFASTVSSSQPVRLAWFYLPNGIDMRNWTPATDRNRGRPGPAVPGCDDAGFCVDRVEQSAGAVGLVLFAQWHRHAQLDPGYRSESGSPWACRSWMR